MLDLGQKARPVRVIAVVVRMILVRMIPVVVRMILVRMIPVVVVFVRVIAVAAALHASFLSDRLLHHHRSYLRLLASTSDCSI
ncbi:MAG: hypothetical protein OXF04_10485 [bacterium]|nr:hypothetical protein [bacterium]MCY4271927.1 hypothetical protein [bacterium]